MRMTYLRVPPAGWCASFCLIGLLACRSSNASSNQSVDRGVGLPSIQLAVHRQPYLQGAPYFIEVFADGRGVARSELGSLGWTVPPGEVSAAAQRLANQHQSVGHANFYEVETSLDTAYFFLSFSHEGASYSVIGPMYIESPLKDFWEATIGSGLDGFEARRGELFDSLGMVVDFEMVGAALSVPTPDVDLE